MIKVYLTICFFFISCSIISLPRNDSLIQQPLASLSQDKIIVSTKTHVSVAMMTLLGHLLSVTVMNDNTELPFVELPRYWL